MSESSKTILFSHTIHPPPLYLSQTGLFNTSQASLFIENKNTSILANPFQSNSIKLPTLPKPYSRKPDKPELAKQQASLRRSKVKFSLPVFVLSFLPKPCPVMSVEQTLLITLISFIQPSFTL